MTTSKKWVHISILKPGRAGPGPRKKDDWTCAYINGTAYDELLALANGDDQAVTNAFRLASERLAKRDGRSWSATCHAGARTLLQKAQELAKAAAAANNAAWE